jgi:hypothetical protein
MRKSVCQVKVVAEDSPIIFEYHLNKILNQIHEDSNLLDSVELLRDTGYRFAVIVYYQMTEKIEDKLEKIM